MLDIDAMMERMKREESLICPYCGHTEDFTDVPDSLITYWGSEGGEIEVACSSCDKDYMVTETVRRTYESRRKEDPTE